MSRENFQNALCKIRLPVENLVFLPNFALPNMSCRGSKTIRYFDQNGIFHSKVCYKGTDLPTGIQGVSVYSWDHGFFFIDNAENARQFFSGTSPNLNLLSSAISKMNEGDTWERFVSVCEEAHFDKKPNLTEFERLIGEIDTPNFERVPENKNKSTFDFIRIFVSINDIYDDRVLTKEAVRKYQPQITSVVLQRLEKNKQFQKYGVPVNFLKLSRLTLTHQNMLEYLFELKITNLNDPFNV